MADPGADGLRHLFLVGCCAALGCASASRNTPPVAPAPDDILAVVRAYDAAWNRRDAGAVAAFLADDYAYFSSRGSVVPRSETLAFLASPDYVLETAERSEVEVEHAGPGVAVVSSRWKGRGSWKGEPFTDDQRCSLVLGRSSRRWLILSEHCTQIAPSS